MPTFERDGWVYITHIDGVSATIVSHNAYDGEDVIVPDQLDGYTITRIGDQGELVIDPNIPLGSLTIPQSVQKIGNYAFHNCSFSGTLTLGYGVSEIGICAFDGCGFTGILSIPDSVTVLGRYAFNNCRFNRLIIGNGLAEIPDSAFIGCLFNGDIQIPNSVQRIGANAFTNCSYVRKFLIGRNCTDIDSYAFSGCNGTFEIEFKGDMPSFGTRSLSFGISPNLTANVNVKSTGWAETANLLQYAGDFTTFTYTTISPDPEPGPVVNVPYEHMKYGGHKVQVDSAIRDGNGMRIDTTYAKKMEFEQEVYVDDSFTITVAHSLGDIPSSVTVFKKVYIAGTYSYSQILVPYEANESTITLIFETQPEYGTKLKIKALI